MKYYMLKSIMLPLIVTQNIHCMGYRNIGADLCNFKSIDFHYRTIAITSADLTNTVRPVLTEGKHLNSLKPYVLIRRAIEHNGYTGITEGQASQLWIHKAINGFLSAFSKMRNVFT